MKRLLMILLTTLIVSNFTACGETQKVVSKPPENVNQVIQEEIQTEPKVTNAPENSSAKTNKKGISYYNVHKDDIKFNTEYLRASIEKDGLKLDIQYSTDEDTELFGYIKNDSNYQVSVYSNLKTSDLYISIVNAEGSIAAKTTEFDIVKENFIDSFIGNGYMTDFKIIEIEELKNEENYDILTCKIVEGTGIEYKGDVYVNKETDEILKIEVKDFNIMFEVIEKIDADIEFLDEAKDYSETEFLMLLIQIVNDAVHNEKFNFTDKNEFITFAIELDSYISKDITITSKEEINETVFEELLEKDFESFYVKENAKNEYILTVNEITHTSEEWSQIIKDELGFKNKVSKEIILHFRQAFTEEDYQLFNKKLDEFIKSDKNIKLDSSFSWNGVYTFDIYCKDTKTLQKLYAFLDENYITY